MGRRANQVWRQRRTRIRTARTVDDRLDLEQKFGKHRKFRSQLLQARPR